MALGNMLAGVGSFFDGWKSMDEIINSHEKMKARQEEIEGYQAGKALSDEDARERERRRADPTYAGEYGGSGETTGSSSGPSSEIKTPGVGAHSARYSGPGPTEEITSLINKAAEQYKVDPIVLTGLLSVESSFNPKAVSPAGAQGIAQLMPGTAAGLGVKDPFDPTQAIPAAANYLRQGLDAHGGDINKALMYYHGGPNQRMWGPITQAYPGVVLGRARQLGPGYDPSAYPTTTTGAPAASATPAASVAPAPSALSDPDLLGGTTRAASVPTTSPTSALGIAPGPVVGGPPIPDAGRLVMDPSVPRTAQGRAAAAPMSQVSLDYANAVSKGFRGSIHDFTKQQQQSRTAGSGGGTPPMPGPGAGGNPYNTSLQPTQEAAFRAWVKNNKVKFNPDQDMTDYDMRGFWRAQQQGDPRAQTTYNPDANETHFPDIWKTPIHKTFSNESMYAPPTAPRWEGSRLISPDGTVLFDNATGSALGG